MAALVDKRGESLWRGDIIRLADSYDTGPGSGPVDLMVYDPHDDDAGLGLLVVSGYKAGLTFAVLPAISCGTGKRSIEVDWLLDNWADWFCYTYHTEESGRLLPIPVTGTIVLQPQDLSIAEEADDEPPALFAVVDYVLTKAGRRSIATFLSMTPGRFYPFEQFAPELGGAALDIQVSWSEICFDEYVLVITYLDEKSWRSTTTMHTKAFVESLNDKNIA